MTSTVPRTLEQFITDKKTQFYFKTDAACDDAKLINLKQRRQALRQFFVSDVTILCQDFFKRTIKDVVPLSSGGTFHLLYLVTDSDDRRYVVRINIPEFGNISYEFLIDQWIYKLLGEHQLPTLQVYGVDLSRTKFPFDYEIIEYAAGKQLSILQDPETQYLPLSIFKSLGQFLARLHCINVNKFGPIDIRSLINHDLICGVHEAWHEYVICNLDQHIAFCQKIGAITSEQACQIAEIFKQHSALFEIKTAILLHGDLGNHNLFSDGSKITAIIDWEDCMAGDPIFDIAYWGTFFRDPQRELLLAGYYEDLRLPDDFELRYWLYYLRVSLSKTVHRHRFGYADIPGRPPASTRITKALDNFFQHDI